MKVPFTAIHGSIRFSLSRYNSEEDIDQIIEAFPEVVERLRRASPYWDVKQNAPREEAYQMLQEAAAVHS
jgi:cysteine desulfurase